MAQINSSGWFKNLRIYRITKAMSWDADALSEALDKHGFKACGPQDTERTGWVAPVGGEDGELVRSVGGRHLVCLRHQQKVLPPAVIKEETDERIEAAEEETGRPLKRAEKTEIKDQVTLELLPRAFTKSKHISAYLDFNAGLVVVDAASSPQAEMLLSELREALGSLPVRPPAVLQAPAFTMTQWLRGEIHPPQGLVPAYECELRDDEENGGVVRIKNLVLDGEEVTTHLDNAMSVVRLGLNWEDSLTFMLDDELTVRRLRFGDAMKESLDDEGGDDALARFDSAFQLMTSEVDRLVPVLLEAFGGEDRSAISE